MTLLKNSRRLCVSPRGQHFQFSKCLNLVQRLLRYQTIRRIAKQSLRTSNNDWVARNRILMFTQRFLGSSRGKHCKYYLYTSSWEIANAAESPSGTSTRGKRMGPGSYLDEAREATKNGTRHDSRGNGNHSPFKLIKKWAYEYKQTLFGNWKSQNV